MLRSSCRFPTAIRCLPSTPRSPGVRIDSYGPQAASLRLLIEAPDGNGGVARAATVVQVSWTGTDWSLIAPPRGDWSTVRALVGPAVVRSYTPLPGR
ncbi:hypothetical protein [Salinispora arenicola]|uniref:hypothetical protein n=1 Tax=Salinispora arenicola TaxID=168697 RepID=UPI0027DBF33C|nr:hypothetical protein [Salinispora arenicola]